MSSHREAPETSKDPVADNTDTYAFVSPDKSDTVTLITNYIPFEEPAGGPNFYEFGDDVLYEINIDNNGDGEADIVYQFRFQTQIRNPDTFLYNTGPIESIGSPNWNRPQFYSVTRVERRRPTQLASKLPSPPCNIGPRSTPDYETLAESAVHRLDSGETVFAGQRDEGFYVDLGAVFDLLDLRPFQNLHLIPTPAQSGVDNLKNLSVHTIAIQVPKSRLLASGSASGDPASSSAVIGVWGSASRQRAQIRGIRRPTNTGTSVPPRTSAGSFVQVSRLANPLFNEVIVPMSLKDAWNASKPSGDEAFLKYVERPEVSKLLPVLYPGVFPNLAALTAPRADLVAILLTGIPTGIVPGFQNFTGPTKADLMRLNTAIPPSGSPNILGLIGGDLAGFPNGRRVFDDVVAIELRALAGATYPLVDPTYTPDAAATQLDDGVTRSPSSYLPTFPYLGVPVSGYDVPVA